LVFEKIKTGLEAQPKEAMCEVHAEVGNAGMVLAAVPNEYAI